MLHVDLDQTDLEVVAQVPLHFFIYTIFQSQIQDQSKPIKPNKTKNRKPIIPYQFTIKQLIKNKLMWD